MFLYISLSLGLIFMMLLFFFLVVNFNCDVLIVRDEEFKKRGKGVIKIVSFEEFFFYFEECGFL